MACDGFVELQSLRPDTHGFHIADCQKLCQLGDTRGALALNATDLQPFSLRAVHSFTRCLVYLVSAAFVTCMRIN